jgi:hypothetical protein
MRLAEIAAGEDPMSNPKHLLLKMLQVLASLGIFDGEVMHSAARPPGRS